jgi:hypothetical protein
MFVAHTNKMLYNQSPRLHSHLLCVYHLEYDMYIHNIYSIGVDFTMIVTQDILSFTITYLLAQVHILWIEAT